MPKPPIRDERSAILVPRSVSSCSAEPVAMLFEAAKVVLRGRFRELEAELLGVIAGGDYEGSG